MSFQYKFYLFYRTEWAYIVNIIVQITTRNCFKTVLSLHNASAQFLLYVPSEIVPIKNIPLWIWRQAHGNYYTNDHQSLTAFFYDNPDQLVPSGMFKNRQCNSWVTVSHKTETTEFAIIFFSSVSVIQHSLRKHVHIFIEFSGVQ